MGGIMRSVFSVVLRILLFVFEVIMNAREREREREWHTDKQTDRYSFIQTYGKKQIKR